MRSAVSPGARGSGTAMVDSRPADDARTTTCRTGAVVVLVTVTVTYSCRTPVPGAGSVRGCAVTAIDLAGQSGQVLLRVGRPLVGTAGATAGMSAGDGEVVRGA